MQREEEVNAFLKLQPVRDSEIEFKMQLCASSKSRLEENKERMNEERGGRK